MYFMKSYYSQIGEETVYLLFVWNYTKQNICTEFHCIQHLIWDLCIMWNIKVDSKSILACVFSLQRVLLSNVIHTCTVFLVFGQLKAGSTLAWHPAFAWSLSADVSTAMVLVHTVHSICARDEDKGTWRIFRDVLTNIINSLEPKLQAKEKNTLIKV